MAASPHAALGDASNAAAQHRAPEVDGSSAPACRVRKKRHWVDDKVMFDAGRLDMMEMTLRAILASSPNRPALVQQIQNYAKAHADEHDGLSPEAYLDGFSLQVTRLLY